jgi:hypothetical protein
MHDRISEFSSWNGRSLRWTETMKAFSAGIGVDTSARPPSDRRPVTTSLLLSKV